MNSLIYLFYVGCNEISTLTVNYVRVISHHYVRH